MQSDEAPGELIPVGEPVTWTYDVTNTGTTALADSQVTDSQGVAVLCDVTGDGVFDTNPIPFMLPGDVVACEGSGVAIAGPYANDSDVVGNPITPNSGTCDCDPNDPTTWTDIDPADFLTAIGEDGEPLAPVADDDPSHYIGQVPPAAIDIEKFTNGVQSDEAPGETLPADSDVTWTYVVTNFGGTALSGALVTDSQGVEVLCDVSGDGVFDTNPIPLMVPGDEVTCEGTGIAIDGPYENDSDVSGTPVIPDFATCDCDPSVPSTWPTDAVDFVPALDASGEPLGAVSDEDPSHYTGATFDLALNKRLSPDTDVANLRIGSDVTYEIEVINQGTVDAVNVTIVEYTPAAMSLNDDDWTLLDDGNGSVDIDGVVAAGESVIVEVTMTINEAGDIDNTAEISSASALTGSGEVLPDFPDADSVADAADVDVLIDDETDSNAADGDEDDHDIATISVLGARLPVPTPTVSLPPVEIIVVPTPTVEVVVPTPTVEVVVPTPTVEVVVPTPTVEVVVPTQPLAFTGNESVGLVMRALLLLGLGSLAIGLGRRRRRLGIERG